MDPNTFKTIEPLLDRFAELSESHFKSAELQQVLTELAAAVGEKTLASFNITVDVFDEQRECALPLLTMGISATAGKQPFQTWGDSTPHRYVIAEGIQVVPHDRCPGCWQLWDFKLQNPTCSNCGMTLGKDCTLLLDTDKCPWCEEGIVTVAHPRCSKCGHEVDRKSVTWG